MKNVLRYVSYPLMTVSAVVFALWALDRGWSLLPIGITAIVVGVILTELLERVIPYREAWAEPRGDRFTDFLHLCLSNRAFDLGSLAAVAACVPIGGWLSKRLGVTLWPHHWPVLLQALLATLIYELPWYWIHRIEHRIPLLWRVHSVHHSSQRIYWWNFSRNHPFDNLVSALCATAPLAVLGVGEAPLAVVAAFGAAHGLLQHSNVDLRTGWIDYVLATARVHRWHHSPTLEESDANFCPRFMLWDHMFRTFRFDPETAPPEDVGLGALDADYPVSFVDQMLIPFRSAFWKGREETSA